MDARRNGTSAARDAVRKCNSCSSLIVSDVHIRHDGRAISIPLYFSREENDYYAASGFCALSAGDIVKYKDI